MSFRKCGLAAAALLLGGCGDSGDALSSCVSIGPNTNSAVVAGGVDNLDAVADGALGTFATLAVTGSGSYVSSKGNDFAGDTNAGAFVTLPEGKTAADITVSTFASQEQATVESATGPTLTLTPTDHDPATVYASLMTTAPFNGVRVQANTSGEFQVFEICGAATVR
jgi:hypothetical protein